MSMQVVGEKKPVLQQWAIAAGVDKHGTRGTVEVDGKEIRGVRRIEAVIDVHEIPVLRLEIVPEVLRISSDGLVSVDHEPAPADQALLGRLQEIADEKGARNRADVAIGILRNVLFTQQTGEATNAQDEGNPNSGSPDLNG